MRIIGRILSCIFAFVLAVTVLGTHLAVLAHHVVGSEAFLKQPAQSIRPEQLQKMNEFVGKLSDEYGFDPSSISGEISADAFERYGNEVVSFLGTLLKEQQEEDAELIFPYFMTTNMLDTVRDDPGFQAKMEKGLQRTVSQNDIVTPVEQMAQRLIFPIRPQLIIAGYNTVSETVNIPDALPILDKWWVIPAAGVLLILLILLCDHRYFAAWTGSGLAGGALMVAAVLAFGRAIGFSSYVGQINPLFARYLMFVWKNMWMTGAVYAAVMLLVGVALLIVHVRGKRAAA